MGQIGTARGVILYDNEDADIVASRRWHVHPTLGYAMGGGYYMHRVILGLTSPNQISDHINGNKIDNRRANLRVCTRTENNRNRRGVIRKNGYKGVYLQTNTGRWAAEANHKYLGAFATAEEAALAYNRAALELHGEFARLNVVPIIAAIEAHTAT